MLPPQSPLPNVLIHQTQAPSHGGPGQHGGVACLLEPLAQEQPELRGARRVARLQQVAAQERGVHLGRARLRDGLHGSMAGVIMVVMGIMVTIMMRRRMTKARADNHATPSQHAARDKPKVPA